MVKTVASIALLAWIFTLPGTGNAQERIREPGERARPLQVLHGKVPSNPDYLKFMSWHEQHSVLTLVVNGRDRAKTKDALEKLVELQNRNVLISELIVVETKNFDLFTRVDTAPPLSKAALQRAIRKALPKTERITEIEYQAYLAVFEYRKRAASAAAELKLGTPAVVPTREIVEKYNISSSPAWIVRYHGEDYVYEGNINPRILFSVDGRFLGADDPSAERHVRRTSGERLSNTELFAYRFTFPLPHGAGSYDGKPHCDASRVRRRPVIVDSRELTMFDMLFYDYRDSAQSQSASRWDRPTVPYLEGDLVNPHHQVNLQQQWARFFDIRCLPTRVHYPTEAGIRYEEYREGERAFDNES